MGVRGEGGGGGRPNARRDEQALTATATRSRDARPPKSRCSKSPPRMYGRRAGLPPPRRPRPLHANRCLAWLQLAVRRARTGYPQFASAWRAHSSVWRDRRGARRSAPRPRGRSARDGRTAARGGAPSRSPPRAWSERQPRVRCCARWAAPRQGQLNEFRQQISTLDQALDEEALKRKAEQEDEMSRKEDDEGHKRRKILESLVRRLRLARTGHLHPGRSVRPCTRRSSRRSS